ncbi:hypothetical protein TruAng_011913 [Truncatella angustata]|nr:hypothetical protein TruAng_011913 [Truncatella angustata]
MTSHYSPLAVPRVEGTHSSLEHNTLHTFTPAPADSPSENDIATYSFLPPQKSCSRETSHLHGNQVKEKQTSLNPSLAYASTENITGELGPTNTSSDAHATGASYWWLEIGAIVLSLGSMVTGIAVLHSQNENPLESWTFVVSLNTLVSILGVIARTTLAFAISSCIGQQKWNWFYGRQDQLVAFERFDEASRGPWGSVKLLYWLKARTINTDQESAIIGKVESLYLGNMYEEYNNFWWIVEDTDMTIPTYWFSGQPDFGLASATYNGFSSSSTFRLQTTKYTCVSGNCTWPLYTSLAICSACNDVSSNITRSSGVAGLTYHDGFSNLTLWNQATQNGTDVPLTGWYRILPHSYTSYEVPYSHIKTFDGLRGTGIGPMPDMAEDLYLYDHRTLMTVGSTAKRSETISFQNLETLLAAFIIMKAPNTYFNNETVWENSTPTATECALSLCVNAYQTSVHAGELNENVVDSWTIVDPRSWLALSSVNGSLDPASQHCEGGTDGHQTCTDGNFISDDRDLHDGGPLRSDLVLLAPADKSLGIPSSRFPITQVTLESTIQFLLSLTISPENLDNSLSVYPAGFWDQGRPKIVCSLINSTSFTSTFETVARSITDYIRDVASVEHYGTMERWAVYARVDWGYMTLPAVSMLIGCLYVLFTIVNTVRLGLPVWKESALKVLTYGLDSNTQESLRGGDGQGKFDDVARRTMIRFEENVDGLRLQVA